MRGLDMGSGSPLPCGPTPGGVGGYTNMSVMGKASQEWNAIKCWLSLFPHLEEEEFGFNHH